LKTIALDDVVAELRLVAIEKRVRRDPVGRMGGKPDETVRRDRTELPDVGAADPAADLDVGEVPNRRVEDVDGSAEATGSSERCPLDGMLEVVAERDEAVELPQPAVPTVSPQPARDDASHTGS
jgi:hypothetical protein